MNEIFFRVFVYINARFWEILHESPDFFFEYSRKRYHIFDNEQIKEYITSNQLNKFLKEQGYIKSVYMIGDEII